MIAVALVALLASASLTLAWIDFRRGIIPDWLNLLIALAGLAWAWLLDGWIAALDALLKGLVVGFIVYVLRWVYFRVRGCHGLGLGDVKLLAASAIWIGTMGVPIQLLVGSITALLAVIALHIAGRTMTRQTALPFGPFLALGLLATLALQQQDWLS
ncbi:prepilin peptidase [Bradyrhizobium sp. KB893862 SZCCT0404]|uniref:prepilin peptidase n=1 Tax=Bradyrhizobium sp. KB893862 SZCCT0404 TaxID=2807672 RepID=UPI001BA7D741|nr:A24 family peptidase [Bradyrhizobium sp. KB893862 SZCCT0404]MBR1175254.1 prepilin peptidase [Bradyrhizobium sp. KB893862 SZCCT0404]